MFVIVCGNRILGRSTTIHGADAIRQQHGRGVLCELLCPVVTDSDRGFSETLKPARKTANRATSKKRH